MKICRSLYFGFFLVFIMCSCGDAFSQSTAQVLEGWQGEYSYEEIWETVNEGVSNGIVYRITIGSQGENTVGRFNAMGFMTDIDVAVGVRGDEKQIELYTLQNSEMFAANTVLLSLYWDGDVIKTTWGAVTPVVIPSDNICFCFVNNKADQRLR